MSVLTPASVSSLSSCEVRRGVRCQRCKVTAFVLQMTKKPGPAGPKVLLAAVAAVTAGHSDTGSGALGRMPEPELGSFLLLWREATGPVLVNLGIFYT